MKKTGAEKAVIATNDTKNTIKNMYQSDCMCAIISYFPAKTKQVRHFGGFPHLLMIQV